jgi:hypothetical protein
MVLSATDAPAAPDCSAEAGIAWAACSSVSPDGFEHAPRMASVDRDSRPNNVAER